MEGLSFSSADQAQADSSGPRNTNKISGREGGFIPAALGNAQLVSGGDKSSFPT